MVENALNPAGEIVDTGVPAHIAANASIAEQHDWHLSNLRRHRVSRRNFLVGAAAVAAAAGVGNPGWNRVAYAQDAPLTVGGRHLSFGSDAATQLRFSAQLSRNPGLTGVFLDHGPTPALGATTSAEVRNLVSQVPRSDGGILAAEQFYVHVPVDGLTPRLPHYYRWRTADGYVSDVRSAAPALPPGRLAPFRFTMMGDQGVDETPTQPPGLKPGDYDDLYYKPDNEPSAKHAANIVRQIADSRPDFHILAGDIAYADPSGQGRTPRFVPSGGTVDKAFDKFNPYVWDGYLAAIEQSAASTPWLFATGNHDMEALYGPNGYGGHAARLDQPDNGPAGCPSVYSFVHGNVAVLSLDANDVSNEIRANTGYSGGRQTGWVESTLARYRADPAVDFIVCFFHHCAYSTTKDHASDGGVRSAWAGLFDRYHVDVVLQAHNHVFERSDPIRGGSPTRVAGDRSEVTSVSDGTVYYTVGGGGRPRYGFQDGEPESYRGNEVADTSVPNSYVVAADGSKVPESLTWSRVRFRNYSFVRADVTPGIPGITPSRMRISAVDEYGREFDEVTFRRELPLAFGS
ncbi:MULTISPECIES: metallophosphoesterase family protein [unclassified Rhodococcus (in: high G+C Gram-positive bacteria)]|uniref:metallophosphoesterase family protein n=1 Tax=unclassified Rhodococcus (in: high G+C Gram-positive bacteria) TaxID=192944 RepID=UPI0004838232|nr:MULTISPECIES: metallophosphoesterase [unclassified Rhodococcus (in: high G+C Gram-positive bacteria)]KQU36041.1 phosphoesterase [Rhodococcus sp. Leaf225]KQU48589.1 phosphoesterase [Rhodococcus sp. Leaf258]MBY6707275.1 metallophosphoesterase [Rhodococcus sp. BP-241]